ncbi:hypothetical protein Tco_0140942 [Tanacetum coccineum]
MITTPESYLTTLQWLGDENPIRTLGDYSKPSHEGYRNTIELPEGNNVAPLRSDTIRLLQNGCLFYELRSEDPNQHLKDFLKVVDLLDLNGSISTWEDLTTRFLAQFFPPRRTAKLRNCEIDRAAASKLPYKNADESWELIENLALYDREDWIDSKDHADDELAKSAREKVTKNEEDEPVGVSCSHDVRYYMNHRINEKQIEGLVENHKFNDSLSATQVGKLKQKTYNLLPKGLVHDAILKKKITRKEDMGENFEIPCNIGGLKHTNALADQGSDEDKIKLHQEKEMKFDQWRIKIFNNEQPASVKEECEVEDEGEVTYKGLKTKQKCATGKGATLVSFTLEVAGLRPSLAGFEIFPTATSDAT